MRFPIRIRTISASVAFSHFESPTPSRAGDWTASVVRPLAFWAIVWDSGPATRARESGESRR